ncbi:ATP-binding cassette domain-containing protein [Lysobacter sp. TY2-98]|uniref:ABC transporter transmembrane domain-containing protein n=1 Tax=Lysobacter sp. TY2-98 TaxID=2290922 RepID=UPI000E1FEA88|nr:ABC transporter transmembrane domain-containing protein [Lysobacter sp. TY2-98]AXK72289.1 ATP-binding cassette domain-containing protein [Lysobacter sp. TY2-98]
MPDAADGASPASRLAGLRTLWPFVQRHRGLFASWLVALGISSAATLTLPVAFRRVIDHGFANGTPHAIDVAFLPLIAVVAVLALGTAARFYFVSLLGERVVADLRDRLYGHLLALDAAFHDRTRSGELVSRLSADTELLRTLVASTMSIALRSAVTVIGSVVMLFATSPRLAAYAMVGIPLSVAPIVIGARRMRKIARTSQDRVADANTVAAETLGAISTVRAHARESYERARFGDALRLAVATARKRIGAQSIVTAVAISLVFGAITVVLWLGAHDVVAGRMTGGVLVQFLIYAAVGGGSIGALAEVWNELQRATGGMGRIAELLEETPQVIAPASPRALPAPVTGGIEFDHVDFAYPAEAGRLVLRDFSLRVRPGETVALVGPSGAGKSTVFSLLMRFHDVSSGAIRVDGVPIDSVDPTDLRGAIALVAQHPTLFATSIRENVRYGRLDADDDVIERALRAAHAADFVHALPQGLDTTVGERGARLSGGQQQRIAIARAVLRDAPILLLDEATSALDAQSEAAVQAALDELMDGRTTLVVAHRLATVLKADRIVVMDAGRIIAEGTHADLMAQGGLYAELARLQFIDD